MRRITVVLIFLTITAVLSTVPCRAEKMTLEGTWKIQVLWGGFFEIQYLQTFTQDGKTMLFLPTGGPVNEGDSRIACTGEWQRAGVRSFDVTMYCLGTQEWAATPDRIRARLMLNKKAQSFTDCPFVYEVFLPNGDIDLDWSGPGVMTGERLPLVPLD